jgi:hypothetical protein
MSGDSLKTAQQGHYVAANCRIDDLINPGEGKVILGASLVQVGKVCAHSPFSVLFTDHHDAG